MPTCSGASFSDLPLQSLCILLVLCSIQLESYTKLGALFMEAEIFELHILEDNHVFVCYNYDIQDLSYHSQYS